MHLHSDSVSSGHNHDESHGHTMSMVTTLIPTVARNRVQEQPAILVTVAPIRLGKN